MIMIDVLIPPLDRVYDFEVNENIMPYELINKLERLIEKIDKVSYRAKNCKLFTYRMGDFLNEKVSLDMQGIRNGDRLILV